MTWTTQAYGTEVNESKLLALLEYHQNAEWNALTMFGRHKNIFVGLFVAVLTVGAAALKYPPPVTFVVLLMPILVVLLRASNKKSIGTGRN